MQRRTFIQLVAGASAAAVGVTLREDEPLLAPPPDAPLFPGLPLSLTLRPGIEQPCDVALVWQSGEERTLGGIVKVDPGAPKEVPLPWPWPELRSGSWEVHAVATDGVRVHRLALGTCRVRSLRFGA